MKEKQLQDITALYGRLSRDDEVGGESMSIHSSAPFWGSMPRNTVLRIASSLWMMATPAQTLTALRLLK